MSNILYIKDAQGAFHPIPAIKGDAGKGIASVTQIGGTHAAGTLDTYRITYTDDTYTDYQIYNGADGEGVAGTELPLMDGNAAVGTSTAFARQDHVHPSDSNKIGYDNSHNVPIYNGCLYIQNPTGSAGETFVQVNGQGRGSFGENYHAGVFTVSGSNQFGIYEQHPTPRWLFRIDQNDNPLLIMGGARLESSPSGGSNDKSIATTEFIQGEISTHNTSASAHSARFAEKANKMTLLWTNPNPTETFVAQPINVDLSTFVAVLIKYKITNTVSNIGATHVIPVDGITYSARCQEAGASTIRTRGATATAEGVSFTVGYSGTTSGAQHCIPIAIYGIQ